MTPGMQKQIGVGMGFWDKPIKENI